MRVDVLIKLIFFNIEIDIYNIIARLKITIFFILYIREAHNDDLIQFRIINNNVNVEIT